MPLLTPAPTATASRHLATYLLDGLCALLLLVALMLPNNLEDITSENETLSCLPLEFVLLGLLLLVPGRVGWILRLLASTLLAAGLWLKAADLALFQIYARPFNPIFDAYLLSKGVHLLQGALGKAGAAIAVLLLVILAAVLVALAFWVLGRLSRRLKALVQPRSTNWRLGAAAVLALVVGIAFAGSHTATPFYDLVTSHWRDTSDSIRDLDNFRREIATNRDRIAEWPTDQLFAKLKGKDVALVFIESYGRTALDKPEFRKDLRPLLQNGAARLEQLGLHSRSAYLTSSTTGGMSWLAQGTALSGLWINSQGLYDSLIMSQRTSLNHLFKRAGWRTVAVKPAITLDWGAEGSYFNYDQAYTAPNLGYKGKPFNWITMPDQYTLSAFEARERQPARIAGQKSVMAEIALVSSHAPWTPVPSLVKWEDVKDGHIFDIQATSGATPDEIWQDDDLIRAQYGKAIAYSLETLISYAEHFADDKLVIIAFGDHQPAPLVTGDTPIRDVPIHLITRDQSVLDAIAGWQWTPGLVPDDHAPVWLMDSLRNRLVETFSETAPVVSEATSVVSEVAPAVSEVAPAVSEATPVYQH